MPVVSSHGWWCREEEQLTTSGGLQHKQEGGDPPGLGRTSTHSEPPRRRKDDNLSPSMSLRHLPHCTGSKGVLGQAGLGWVWASIAKEATLCMCACAPSTLRQTRHRTRWTVSEQGSHCDGSCSAVPPHGTRVYLDALLFFLLLQ